MEQLSNILKLADAELEAINRNGKFRSREEIDSAYKLVDIAKDVYCIWKYEDEMRGDSYDGNSYARGRRRDSMGRYSRDSYRRGYSRDGKAEYIDHLRDMMEDAPDEATRQSMQRMISQMEQM